MAEFAYLDNGGEPILFAHRGGNAADTVGPDGERLNRENSMAAFQAAYDLGYRYFETDVVECKDGLLATHGAGSKAAAGRTGLPLREELQERTWADICDNVRIGGEPVPRFIDVVKEFPDVRINVDAKTPRAAVRLGKLVRQEGIVDRVCIASFSEKRIQRAAEEIDPKRGVEVVCTAAGPLGVAALLAPSTGALRKYLEHSKANCLQVPYRYEHLSARLPSKAAITPKVLARAHDLDTPVHVWTVNDEPDMQRALEEGADGIMSDEVLILRGAYYIQRLNRQAAPSGAQA